MKNVVNIQYMVAIIIIIKIYFISCPVKSCEVKDIPAPY